MQLMATLPVFIPLKAHFRQPCQQRSTRGRGGVSRRSQALACHAAGLGFEDCSAELEAVGRVEQSSPWQKQLLLDDGKSWRFFSFEVDPDDFQVNIHIDQEQEQPAHGCESPAPAMGSAAESPDAA